MKTLIYVLSLVVMLVSLTAKAEAKAEVPFPYMKDGVIKVTLKDGKTYTFSLNDWKVVPRVQEPVEVKPVAPAVVYLPAEKVEEKKNRVTLHGGYGQTGLKTELSPGMAKVSHERGIVFGGTYSRKVTDKYSISGTALSNQTFMLGLGYDF